MSKTIAIIGGGPAGCMSACHIDKSFDITIFDINSPLKTLLPTGGGKCNLAHAEYNFKDLAKNYPRGEKFLYSIFSRFGTQDTLDFFEKIGVKTYVRKDNRIFPISNSSKDVQEKILAQLKHCKFKKEEVLSIKYLQNGFEIKTNQASYLFDIVIVATGGKHGYKLMHDLGHNFEQPHPALVGLKTNPQYKELQGVTIKNCKINSDKKIFTGDILFTDSGITGPAVFEMSSINAKKNFPYNVTIDFLNTDINWQEEFNKNPKKDLGNLINEYLPKSFVIEVFKHADIDLKQKCCMVNSNTKELVNKVLTYHDTQIIGTKKGGETVTCGGLLLDEFNSKTLESKHYSNLYSCGEVLDIDGFCGGFNLQACWSTGYSVAQAINSSLQQ